MTAAEKLQALARWHDEWQRKWADTVEVDDTYANNRPSQYPETIVDMSASQEAQDEYWREARRILGMRAAREE